MNTSASTAIGPSTGFFFATRTRARCAPPIVAAFVLLLAGASAQATAPAYPGAAQAPIWIRALLAQTADEVAEAKAEAEGIIRAAEEEATRIRGEALKNAAQIEADAVRKAAQIEAEAIRNAARASAPSVEAAPAVAPAVRTRSVAAPRERYENLTGIWSWKGNARNRKFELTQGDDGSVKTELWMSPRTRFYREDLRYNDGVLSGRTFQTVKTQTGNDEKRFRDYQLTISEDGESLVGTIIDSSDKNNRRKRLDVVWNRVRN